MKVTKRSGELEGFNLDKIHRVLEWATNDINGVSISDIEMNAQLQLSDKVETRKIHEILIKSANDLISIDNPNYQYVAARLLNYALRKDVWGESEPPRLIDHIKHCVNAGIYDSYVLDKYKESDIQKLGKYIKHKRDELFSYAGIQQLVDKYLIKNRKTGEIYETPQFAYMLIAMFAFADYDSKTRLNYVKRAYDHFSTFKINLPTPIMSGLRTLTRQFASCILINVDDSLDSIFASNTAVGKYTARRAGIGINIGRIRPIGAEIRGGEVISTGLIPYAKMYEATVKSTSQNGIRGGSATVNVPFWHAEIEDVVVLKNNAGTDENRVRKLDYVIQFTKLFYERLIKGESITLLSPDECKDVYEAFGKPEFDEIYKARENDKSVKYKKKIPAKAFAELFARERLETGRIYVMNIDNVNSHNSFIDKVEMTNLCVEVLHPTKPLKTVEDKDAEIGVCILGAVNALEVDFEEYEDVCDILVRFLDAIIDYQDYVLPAAENFCKNRRSLGIGFTNVAACLAHNKVKYGDVEALELLDKMGEYLQYNLVKSSCNLAKELGRCNGRNIYELGHISYDTANAEAKKLVTRTPELNWDALREDLKIYGVRNSTLTCQMPCESSSVIQNCTNGIEPVRDLIVYKKSKKGILKQVVPYVERHSKYYTRAWDITDNKVLTDVSATLQKWMDMGLSTNHYYNYAHYENGNIPLSKIIMDIIYAWKLGIKTLYYSNTPDGDAEASCPGGSCTL